jgi:hypothetical protein
LGVRPATTLSTIRYDTCTGLERSCKDIIRAVRHYKEL